MWLLVSAAQKKVQSIPYVQNYIQRRFNSTEATALPFTPVIQTKTLWVRIDKLFIFIFQIVSLRNYFMFICVINIKNIHSNFFGSRLDKKKRFGRDFLVQAIFLLKKWLKIRLIKSQTFHLKRTSWVHMWYYISMRIILICLKIPSPKQRGCYINFKSVEDARKAFTEINMRKGVHSWFVQVRTLDI